MAPNDKIKSEKEASGKNAIVETYAGDIAEILENDKEGLVKKILEGAEKDENEKKNLSPEYKNNKIFIISSFGLLFLGSLIFSFVLFTRDKGIVPAEEEYPQIIFTDQTSYLEISGLSPEEVKQALLNNAKSADLKNNGVLGIYPVLNKKIAGLRAFLGTIKSSFVPGEEEFISEGFLFGAVKSPGAQAGNIESFILLRENQCLICSGLSMHGKARCSPSFMIFSAFLSTAIPAT